MHEAAIREPEQIRVDCVGKMRPMETSGRIRAVLAFLLREKWTKPVIAELRLMEDGGVAARTEGEVCFKHFLGRRETLIHNVHAVAKSAELDGDEIGFLLAGVAKIKRLN